jgi:hypothetical protein
VAGTSGNPERLGHELAEELEVALFVRVRSLGKDDLTADQLVAVERVADDEVAGVASEDAAVRGLDEFRQSLDRRLDDVDAFGVAGDERAQIGPADRSMTTSPVAGLVKVDVPVRVSLKSAWWGASNSLPRASKAISIAWPVPQKSGSTTVPTSWKRLCCWPAPSATGVAASASSTMPAPLAAMKRRTLERKRSPLLLLLTDSTADDRGRTLDIRRLLSPGVPPVSVSSAALDEKRRSAWGAVVR